jgi:hypothetical protein
MFGPKGPFCQSCGMPLSKDANYKSGVYCTRCFRDGKFIQPNLTVDQMQERVKGKLKEMHIPGFLTGYFTKDIPKLKRWK